MKTMQTTKKIIVFIEKYCKYKVFFVLLHVLINHRRQINMTNIPILVIHVQGNRERELFIRKQLEGLGMPFIFILEGNKESLTQEILDRYFADNGKADTMYGRFPRTSCAYKHILAMEHIRDNNLDGALIVEDDLRIYPSFSSVFTQSMKEYEQHYSHLPFIANYEESSLMLVPRSMRKAGQTLYPAKRDRFAGCYYINHKAAETILDYIATNKSDTTSDCLHNRMVQQGLIKYYWSHPCIACQCSCDGSMPTMIPTKPRPLKRLKWYYKRLYKHLLYFLR